jgi:hypothetical protein
MMKSMLEKDNTDEEEEDQKDAKDKSPNKD